jgi:glycosyltransferase involved in cell wall biosynthesis
MLINVTIPVYNEEAQVSASVKRLGVFLRSRCVGPFEIVIADNASTDRTLELANQAALEIPEARVLHLDAKGRGRALRRAWTDSSAEILSYMDVDLSTDLEFFPALIGPLTVGWSDLSAGSRLHEYSETRRGLKREILSHGYNLLVKWMFASRFSDAQCGFKAVTRRAARELLPLVKDDAWFFDTELLLLAERLGYRVFDLPVRWVDDPDSRVKIWSTAWGDIKGLVRLRRRFKTDRAWRAASDAEAAAEAAKG